MQVCKCWSFGDATPMYRFSDTRFPALYRLLRLDYILGHLLTRRYFLSPLSHSFLCCFYTCAYSSHGPVHALSLFSMGGGEDINPAREVWWGSLAFFELFLLLEGRTRIWILGLFGLVFGLTFFGILLERAFSLVLTASFSYSFADRKSVV